MLNHRMLNYILLHFI